MKKLIVLLLPLGSNFHFVADVPQLTKLVEDILKDHFFKTNTFSKSDNTCLPLNSQALAKVMDGLYDQDVRGITNGISSCSFALILCG